jgi:hypothetical protein
LTYEINHASVIYREEIGEFLEYIDDIRSDSEDTDLSAEERAEAEMALTEYDYSLIEQLRVMYDGSEEEFISEDYWKEYASDYADDFLLDSAEPVISRYFDYDTWAHDLQTDYTPWVYDGVTYYSRA